MEPERIELGAKVCIREAGLGATDEPKSNGNLKIRRLRQREAATWGGANGAWVVVGPQKKSKKKKEPMQLDK